MRLSPLDRKLLRDLKSMRGPAIAIALVVAAGVALFVVMLSTYQSLQLTQTTYYRRYRFADVFASMKRAPSRLEEEIAALPGVARVETRVVADVTLDVPDRIEPAVGRLISIPADRRPILNDLYLARGRWIEPGKRDEVLVGKAFADANHLVPGDSIAAVINGRRRDLEIVGVALSPEYVYAVRPGEIVSDDALFGVFWMERRSLAAAFDMEGGFNDVVLTLDRDASEAAVIDDLDALLEPYGGLGAIPRALQGSHFYLESELQGLEGMAAVIPIVFLAVAAFLLNVVLARMVAVQREQIAALKALGYSNAAVAFHYLKWGLAIGAAGTALGLAVGVRMGLGMTRLYTEFFHFPILAYRLSPEVVGATLLLTAAAATLGALGSVRRAVTLPPAEAMRPEPPAVYRQSWVERAGARALLSQPARMVLRNLARHPGRAALSAVGIAFGGAMLIVGTFSMDSMNWMMDVQFHLAQRYDALVSFVEPASPAAWDEVRHLPGVIDAEPFRALPAKLSFRHRSRQTAITGMPSAARLNRVLDTSLRPLVLPPEGLVLSAKLGEILGVRPGDRVTVEVLVQDRPRRRVTVAGLVDDYVGINAYMDLAAVHRLMQESPVLSGAYLQLDEGEVEELYRAVKQIPAVAGVTLKGAAIESWRETLMETFNTMRAVMTLFAAIMAFGVVYNSARVSLSERSRELATLRVIGFRRAEIATILLGELTLVTLAAVPAGLLLGYGLAAGVSLLYDLEVYRLPLVVSRGTFALSALTVCLSAVVSGLAVRRKLRRLDLIGVLKTRE